MRKLITGTVSAAALAGLTMTGGTATAATTPAEGPAKVSCARGIHTYELTYYRGGWKEFCGRDNNLNNNKFNNRHKVDNNIRSVKNTSRCTWKLYRAPFGYGFKTTIRPRQWDANLANNVVGTGTSSIYRSC
ncbi:hypothetical protein GCM10010411_75600 [Actinomadura fulvescens]|uniref:Peptidase inhibitor family I36 n=1 Tax=Actinomadura fulvescens TaxID=46160 RepID=A0ABP6CTR6_9ACTN